MPGGADRSAAPSLAGQALRFGAVGVVGFAVNAGLVALLAGPMGPEWAQVVAFPAAVTTTWSLNRRYTFQPRAGGAFREWMRYVVANALGWTVNNGLYFTLVLSGAFFHQNPVVAVAAGSLAGMVFNFATSKWIVFR